MGEVLPDLQKFDEIQSKLKAKSREAFDLQKRLQKALDDLKAEQERSASLRQQLERLEQ